jgi:hypothetical protein
VHRRLKKRGPHLFLWSPLMWEESIRRQNVILYYSINTLALRNWLKPSTRLDLTDDFFPINYFLLKWGFLNRVFSEFVKSLYRALFLISILFLLYTKLYIKFTLFLINLFLLIYINSAIYLDKFLYSCHFVFKSIKRITCINVLLSSCKRI